MLLIYFYSLCCICATFPLTLCLCCVRRTAGPTSQKNWLILDSHQMWDQMLAGCKLYWCVSDLQVPSDICRSKIVVRSGPWGGTGRTLHCFIDWFIDFIPLSTAALCPRWNWRPWSIIVVNKTAGVRFEQLLVEMTLITLVTHLRISQQTQRLKIIESCSANILTGMT